MLADMAEIKNLPFKDGYIDGITILNLEGEVLFSAKFNGKLSNLDESQKLIGKRYLDVYENLTPENSTLYRAMQTGGPIYEEKQYVKRIGKDGITITAFSIPIRSGDRIVGAIDLSCQESGENESGSDRVEISLTEDSFRREQTHKLVSQMRAIYEYDDIIAINRQMRSAKEYIKVVSSCNLPVMLCGEIGTGKEMFAHAIHNSSERRAAPFLSQNCAATPETLLEKVLFGVPESKGILELADGGTVFLDEIDGMPPYLQYKLLRVLQNGALYAADGAAARRLDVKIIASLSRDPKQCIEDGTLRQDVYYYLSKLSISIPPLRERREDIRCFVETYIKKHNKTFHKNIRYISNKLIDKLQECAWPGNTGELEQVVIYGMSVVDSKSDTLRFSDIEKRYRTLARLSMEESMQNFPPKDSLDQAVNIYERELIQRAFTATSGNITEAATILNIPRQTLQRKIKQYQIRQANE